MRLWIDSRVWKAVFDLVITAGGGSLPSHHNLFKLHMLRRPESPRTLITNLVCDNVVFSFSLGRNRLYEYQEEYMLQDVWRVSTIENRAFVSYCCRHYSTLTLTNTTACNDSDPVSNRSSPLSLTLLFRILGFETMLNPTPIPKPNLTKTMPKPIRKQNATLIVNL